MANPHQVAINSLNKSNGIVEYLPVGDDNVDRAIRSLATSVSDELSGKEDGHRVKVRVTSAELKALVATPKTLIAAPAAGKAIVVKRALIMLNYGTAQYTDAGGAVTINIGTVIVITTADLSATICAAASGTKFLTAKDAVVIAPATALTLKKITNELAAGDSTVDVVVDYEIIDAV